MGAIDRNGWARWTGISGHDGPKDLGRIARAHGIELGHTPVTPSAPEVDAVYYPQFDAAVRIEASSMSKHYEIFYALEKTIRTLVAETIDAIEKRDDWWSSSRVPAATQVDVKSRIQEELDSVVTRRSLDELDYTTFGELSVIIVSNWDIFGSLFTSKKALEKTIASLNAICNPIAHCSLLAEDEVLRLQLTVRDWFRLME